MLQTLVSIIIPTYNRAHLISETLDSVLAQTYQNWECIVIDDGSTDDTSSLLHSYIEKDSRFQYYKRPDTHLPGGNGARNYGFIKSSGDFINWLDSDDVFFPEKLEVQIQLLQEKKAKVCVANARFFIESPYKAEGELWSEYLLVVNDSVTDALILKSVRWQTASVLWSRDTAMCNTWDETLAGAQEWLFHILQSLKLQDADFCFLNTALVGVRSANISITRNASLETRYTSYLQARLILLRFLKNENKDLFNKYYRAVFLFSLRYVMFFINANSFGSFKAFNFFIGRVSIKQFIKFNFGVLFYKLFKKSYFLKRVVKKEVN